MLLAAWSVLCGDHRMLVPLVVAAHVLRPDPRALPRRSAWGWSCSASARSALQIWHARRDVERRGPPGAACAWSVGVGVVLWLPPVADQLTQHAGQHPPAASTTSARRPRRRSASARASASPCATSTCGPGSAASSSGPAASSTPPRPIAGGVVTLVVWVVAAVVAWRIGSPGAARAARRRRRRAAPRRRLDGPHLRAPVVLPDAVGVGRHDRARRSPSLVGAGGVAAPPAGRPRRQRPADRSRPWRRAAVAVVVSVASTVAFADAEHPEERLSTAVGALAGPTYDAVVDGVGAATGADGRYLVRWSDAADIGSPGFGLLDELERRGLDVAADEFFHVPVTDHRVRARGPRPTPRSTSPPAATSSAGGPCPTPSRSPRTTPAPTPSGPSTTRCGPRFVERLPAEGLGELVAARRHQPVRHLRRHPAVGRRPGRPRPTSSSSASRWSCSSPRRPPTTIPTRCDRTGGTLMDLP